MASDIITHLAPAWRSRANFIIFADLSESGLEDCWEQLWAEQLGADEFRICCIPFLTYGLSLGDRVETAPRGSRQYVVSSVRERSEQRVYRLWLKEVHNDVRVTIFDYLHAKNMIHELHSENLIAIAIADGEPIASEVEAYLSDLNTQVGLLFERGDE